MPETTPSAPTAEMLTLVDDFAYAIRASLMPDKYEKVQIEEARNALLAAIARSEPPTGEPVPNGWKLVPIEPTPAMLAAADDWHHNKGISRPAYRALLAAAPPIEAQAGEPKERT